MLGDWRGVNQSTAVAYIESCKSWDGAIALIPGQESHGGSTFCGVASLALMGKIKKVLDYQDGDCRRCISWRNELIQWCVSRQIEGIQGRPNKYEDTCYSYWIGGTLKILESDQLLNQNTLKNFIMDCQTDMGGFNKLRNGMQCPDLLHSFYSLAWLSVGDIAADQNDDNESNILHPIHCTLGMSQRRIDDFFTAN